AQLRQQREAAEETFHETEVAHRTALTRFNEQNVAAVQSRHRVDNLRRDLERAEGGLQSLARRAAAHDEELSALLARIAEAEAAAATLAAAVAQLQDAQPALDAALDEARAAHAATRTRLADLEGALRRHRLGREGLLREENTRNVKLA